MGRPALRKGCLSIFTAWRGAFVPVLMPNFDQIPDSEFRRQYCKKLIASFRRRGLSASEARKAVSAMLSTLQEQIYYGHPVELGFIKLQPRRKAPSMITFQMTAAKKKPQYLIGEHCVWRINFSKKWLRTKVPDWARPV